MADEKKVRPSLRRDAPRAKLTTPARDRPKVSVRLEPQTYQRLLDSAEANRVSITAQAERWIEQASAPAVWEEASVTEMSEVAPVIDPLKAPFEAGVRFGNPDRPVMELLRDGYAFDRGFIRAFEALLGAHPEPRWADIIHLMTEIHGVLEKLWRAVPKPDFEQNRTLPKLETLEEMALRDEREHAARKSPTDKDPSQ
jgi:hypothetical protein